MLVKSMYEAIALKVWIDRYIVTAVLNKIYFNLHKLIFCGMYSFKKIQTIKKISQ